MILDPVVDSAVRDVWESLENWANDKKSLTNITAFVGDTGSGKDYYSSLYKNLYEQEYPRKVTYKNYSYANTIKKLVEKNIGLTIEEQDKLKRNKDVLINCDSFVKELNLGNLPLRDFYEKYSKLMKQNYGEFYFANRLIEEFGYDFQLWSASIANEINKRGEIGIKLHANITDLRFESEFISLDYLATRIGSKRRIFTVGEPSQYETKKIIELAKESGWDTFQLPSVAGKFGG